MKILASIISLTLFCILGYGQTKSETMQGSVYIKEVLPVIVAQDNCPITIEKVIVFRDFGGKIESSYLVRNTGDKDIKSYKIARWYSDNTGFVGYGVMPSNATVLKPNQIAGSVDLNSDISTNKLPSRMKKILFVMITEIVFGDDSKFEAGDVLDSLEKHLKDFEVIYDTAKTSPVQFRK